MPNTPIPTVLVLNKADADAETIVNVDDFDPATHTPANDDAKAILAAAGKLTAAAPKALLELTKAELVALAAEKGVTVDAAAVKADIVAALNAAGIK